MPTTAKRPRTDFPSHTRSPEPGRAVPLPARAHPHRRSALSPVSRSGERRASLSELAVLQERVRIARELHDGVAQTLYAITLVASRALELPAVREADQLERLVGHILQLAHTGQVELRALVANLWFDEPSPGGLTQALIGLAAAHQASQGIPVRLALGPEPDLPPATSQALARIAREALHNVARHAQAEHVDLVLEAGATDVALLIADDGHGFDPAIPRPGHFGLRSMRERAAAVRGTLEVASTPGQGTRIRVRVPRDGR